MLNIWTLAFTTVGDKMPVVGKVRRIASRFMGINRWRILAGKSVVARARSNDLIPDRFRQWSESSRRTELQVQFREEIFYGDVIIEMFTRPIPHPKRTR